MREKRGLAYGINSSIVNNEYSSALVISTATRSDRSAETLDIIRAEVKRMADGGVTDEELEAAKKYLIGSYAINNLDTSAASPERWLNCRSTISASTISNAAKA